MNNNPAPQTFWDHLEEFRGELLKIAAIYLAATILLFLSKDQLFQIILAPTRPDFPLYPLLHTTPPETTLINTGLARQFIIHMRISAVAALLPTTPIILWRAYHFISPALYKDERRPALQLLAGSTLMMLLGLLTAYLLIFPLTYHFLATYQVSPTIPNLITLDSYIDTLLTLTLIMSLTFQLPLVMRILTQTNITNKPALRHYRRHAIILLLILSAIITPTADMFTMTMVAAPMYLLYEFGILISK